MPHPRVLVVTSCTGEKCAKPENQLTLADFKDLEQLQQREAELAEFVCAAGKMYTGMQHLRLMEGVQLLRQSLGQDAVDVAILSAGYGLIEENRAIAPYEVTFNGMKGHEVDSWAKFLGIHEAFERAIAGYDLVFVLLGDNYLRALGLPVVTQPEQTLIFLASQGSRKHIRDLAAQTFVLPLTNMDAKRYRYGLVGLKGFVFKKFAEAVSTLPELISKIHHAPQVFLDVLNNSIKEPDVQLSFPEIEIQVKSVKPIKTQEAEEDEGEDSDFLPIPDVDPSPNMHLGMHYFIPEWDDRVSPDYNFLTDTAPENRDPYADDVYAHELYPTPNYDGVLVSKVVVDQNKTKRAKIEDLGIHRFIRFQKPIMGDCGAFGYIKEDVPPYETDEIVDYYERLGFNYGVSIDHLIVGPFAEPGIREKRYDLTLKNAEDFIQRHRERGHSFTPIGVAQGWNPESYAEAVKAVIQMGYDYVALGGLARAQTREILPILEAIRPHLTSSTRLHLFGVARINAIPAFRHLGVTSIDSASFLRRAWLGAGANYHTLPGKMYAAIRIPPVSQHGVRARRLIEAGVADIDTLEKLEREALKALRAFDANELDLDSTLQVILAYDELVELPKDGKVDPIAQAKRRAKHEVLYRQLLEDRPWKVCECPLCQEIGVEVVIFRNNNRNRRRGFHNTYVFYKRFKALLEELKNK